MKVMIVGSTDDAPRRYGWYYLQQLARIADNNGHDVVIMEGPYLNKFENTVTRFNPDFVIINGHGGDRAVVVKEKHALIGVKGYSPELKMNIERGNPELMAGRDVYLFTCNSGKLLMDELINAGAKSVVAYDEPFFWIPDSKINPATDHLAEPIFRSALEYPLSILSGSSKKMAYLKMISQFQRNLRNSDDEDLQKYLYHNMIHLRKAGFGG